ncbi:MAG TPA: Asp-tRNA(Asn)/Glu-tRNA(Gln) amidotransferase subunit GatB [Candidatus Paceibacterota bacterium]|nr:Asp-tRNA(Asn)/Glu-tRNA(Gln) amidotransferase subunit GatB [Candidatus Paceibacterota bacterium]
MSYRPTIGLEVHAELATSTKMFCASRNDPNEESPNVNVCPICLAHPGTLPTINREAVRHVVRVGTAIGGTIADYTEFDRKSYFYPDIPKGYQISQYERPLVAGGALAEIAVTRVHLEEDTARSTHGDGKSLVDFNRAGVPLMELVTEPVIPDAETAGRFARELQQLLRALGASHANLEKGEMRIEANVSVSADDGLGTKVEVKNLNSFRAVERAIAFEIERQSALLAEGKSVTQETRGWDEDRGVTFSQRAKEGSADYRYFPDPDLPKLVLSELSWLSEEEVRASLPELPWERRARYEGIGLKEEDARQLASTLESGAFFDRVLAQVGNDPALAKAAANYLITDVAGSYGNLTPSAFGELMRMLGEGKISSRGAKDVLVLLREHGGDSAMAAAEQAGLLKISDADTLRPVVRAVLAENPGVAGEYRGGKESVLQYLVGQAMKATKGAGDPEALRAILIEEMGA